MRKAAAIVLCALLTGCATEGMSIPIGKSRSLPPTVPAEILILVAPPDQPHEILALVEGVAATDDYFFSEKRTQEAAMTAMRKEAARLGATAIVLTSKGSEPYMQVSTGSGVISQPTPGTGYFTTTSTRVGSTKIRVGGTAVHIVENQQ